MPAQSKPLDPGTYIHIRKHILILTTEIVYDFNSETKKIRCKECFEADSVRTNWMEKRGALRHLRTEAHEVSVQNNRDHQEASNLQRNRIHSAYSTLEYTQLNSSFTNPKLSSRPGLFNYDNSEHLIPKLIPTDPYEDGNGTTVYEDNAVEDLIDNTFIPMGISPLDADLSTAQEQEMLRRQVEMMTMQAEQADNMGPEGMGEDITVTNIMQDLGASYYISVCRLTITHSEFLQI